MKKHEIFKLNLERNSTVKLCDWLYAECLELAAAIMAYYLQKTPKRLSELYEEIADVELLLDQYNNFPGNESTEIQPLENDWHRSGLKNIAIAITNNCCVNPSIDASIYTITSLISLIEALNKNIPDFDQKRIDYYYVKKLKRLHKRLESGEY